MDDMDVLHSVCGAGDGVLMLYGTCGAGHSFTVYLTEWSVISLLHERGMDATQTMLLSRTELFVLLCSASVPKSHIADIWREVCYPHALIGG